MSDEQTSTPEMASGPKTCARCGAGFVCKVDDLPRCQCVNIDLSSALLDQLKGHYSDCLCSRCLKEFAGKERDGDMVLTDGTA